MEMSYAPQGLSTLSTESTPNKTYERYCEALLGAFVLYFCFGLRASQNRT